MGTTLLFVPHVLVEDAGLKMLGKKGDAELVERRSYGHDLLEDISARSIPFNHLLNAGNLARNSRESLTAVCLQVRFHRLGVPLVGDCACVPAKIGKIFDTPLLPLLPFSLLPPKPGLQARLVLNELLGWRD